MDICVCHKSVDVILAVGGGSIIDCAKAIAAAAFYDGDAWELITAPDRIQKALPVCVVLTLAATGSEINAGSVISNPATKQKVGFMHGALLPKHAILDPQCTFTVPARQTAAGAADIVSHILEQYFTSHSTFLSDYLCESVLKTVIHFAPIAIQQPENYEARSQLMWAGSLADNGITSLGNAFSAWSCHGIEHELSGTYDIIHGEGLAILTPRWMRYILNDQTVHRFAEYAVNMWGIDPSPDAYETARQGIAATEAFFKNLGIPMTLSELNIDSRDFAAMAEHAVTAEGLAYAYVPLTNDDVVNILQSCL